MLFTRVTNPPLITQFSSKNVVGAAWSYLKAAGSFADALIVLAVSTRFPDSYGENAFAHHIDKEALQADDVASLLENGGDINKLSKYNARPLHYAVYIDDFELFKTLLENGAIPSSLNYQDEDVLDDAVY